MQNKSINVNVYVKKIQEKETKLTYHYLMKRKEPFLELVWVSFLVALVEVSPLGK